MPKTPEAHTAEPETIALNPRGLPRPQCLRSALAGLFALSLLAGCSDEPAEVVTATTQREANYLSMVLEEFAPKVETATEQRTTVYSIKVAPDNVLAARMKLAERGLPREPIGGLGAIAGSSLSIPTRSEERARLTHAMTEQLRGEIERLPGVVDASIVLVLPTDDTDMLARKKEPARLSVVVTALEGSETGLRTSVDKLIDPIVGGEVRASVEVLSWKPDFGFKRDVSDSAREIVPAASNDPPQTTAAAGGVNVPPTTGSPDWMTGNKPMLAMAGIALLALGLVGAAYLFYRASRVKAREQA